MCFLGNGDGSAPASYGPVAGTLVDLQALEGHGNVVCGLNFPKRETVFCFVRHPPPSLVVVVVVVVVVTADLTLTRSYNVVRGHTGCLRVRESASLRVRKLAFILHSLT